MASRNQKQHLSLLLGLIVFVLLPSPSQQEEEYGFVKWLTQQFSYIKDNAPPYPSPLDAPLAAAEAHQVSNTIDPNSDLIGKGKMYKTISESINNIPDGSTKRYILNLAPGAVFHEKVLISKSKPFITLKSDPTNPAIIVWNDTDATLGKNGKPLGSQGSSTVAIESDYFSAYGIVFRNDAPLPKQGEKKVFAPAIRVLGNKATFHKCTIEGGQGALYDQRGMHYFLSCTIKGTIDIIFGFGRSFYEECNIFSSSKDIIAAKPVAPAQPTNTKLLKDIPVDTGFSIMNSTINGEGKQIYLGRAWGESSPIIYSYTKIDKEVVPIHWDSGDIKIPQRGIAHYGFYDCSGPGADAIYYKFGDNDGDEFKAPRLGLRLTDISDKPFKFAHHFLLGESWIRATPT